MPPTLSATAALTSTWQADFRDRYPLQHAQTLASLEQALAQAAREREARRAATPEWLADRRALLHACVGAGLGPAEATALTLAPLPTGEEAYIVATSSLPRYAGQLHEPTAPARGAVVLAGHGEDATPGLVAAYRAHGLRVVQPFLARAARSFADDPARRWYRFSDDELLHLFAFVVGGSLAGLEAAELRAVLGAVAVTDDGQHLPVALHMRGRHTLTATVLAALWPELVEVLVLHEEVATLDHQEHDARVNTLWGFHRHFDALTLLALTHQARLLFVQEAPVPSAVFARAAAWLGPAAPDGSRVVAHRAQGRSGGADLAAAVATRLGPVHRSAAAVGRVAPTAGTERATPEQRYRQALASKLAYLEEQHSEARQHREQRYALTAQTPTAYRERVAESLTRVMGPPLPETSDRRPRTRLREERPAHVVYEVVLESVPGVDVAGYLLLPREGLPAPAVICQHGLSGRPDYLAGLEDHWIYDRVAQRLADKGYVTFTPFMTWGWGGTPGRDALVKRAYALGITPNRFEVAQLHAIVDFLCSRPEVLAERIAFYGLSYGGHASVWLCAEEPRLAAVVTAGHFNDWHDKLTSLEVTPPLTRPTAYVTVDEGYDMFTSNVLNELGHAEFVTRLAPRPYMVENGLRDTVTPTAWVEREFARVQQVYSWLGAPELAEIEHFTGPHRIWSEGSFRFLHRHLRPVVKAEGSEDQARKAGEG